MNSIRSSLVSMLIAAFTLVTFLAGLNGYLSSMAEAEKLMDSQLENTIKLLVATGQENADGVIMREQGGQFALQVWRNETLVLRSQGAPNEQINDFAPGYRYANFAGYRWRTLTRKVEDSWYIVAERADLRHQLAENLVLESILPLLLWLPLSALLIWVLVGWGLRPLRDLSEQINLKRSDDLEPVSYHNPPSELVQLVDSTNSLLSRLSASFEREKHFAAHAAHELRTPLSVLKVHLHNLAGELPPGHSGLAHANAGVARMHHLVEQILDLNRTNPEIIQGNFRQLDLHSLAQKVTAAAWPIFAAKQQNLSLNGDSIEMTGDDVMLETLLQNLLGNASKYTPSGGECVVTVSEVAGRPRLLVEDSGPGVSREEQDLVFERFYRVGQSEMSGEIGSGLGLAIVQHIVELHNADIWLGASQFESGLSVTIDFPKTDRRGRG
jgi:two-component system sensor histidine kinase QseC